MFMSKYVMLGEVEFFSLVRVLYKYLGIYMTPSMIYLTNIIYRINTKWIYYRNIHNWYTHYILPITVKLNAFDILGSVETWHS